MSAHLQLPFRIAYKTPETLGADRVAAAAEAWCQQPGRDLLVIDMGTAITYDMITSQGIYLGGNIAPGIDMRFKALNHYTGKLPLVSKDGERVNIGDTTDTAIREGVLQGVSYEIKGYIETYKNKYPHLLVFLTGGDTKFLDNRTKSRTFADSLLVLKGLNRILTLNE
jgi:type III pantothenate kinase